MERELVEEVEKLREYPHMDPSTKIHLLKIAINESLFKEYISQKKSLETRMSELLYQLCADESTSSPLLDIYDKIKELVSITRALEVVEFKVQYKRASLPQFWQ